MDPSKIALLTEITVITRWQLWLVNLTTGKATRPAGFDGTVKSDGPVFSTVDGNYVIGRNPLRVLSVRTGQIVEIDGDQFDRWELSMAGTGLEAKRPEALRTGFDRNTGTVYFGVARDSSMEFDEQPIEFFEQTVESLLESGLSPKPVTSPSVCHASDDWSPYGPMCLFSRESGFGYFGFTASGFEQSQAQFVSDPEFVDRVGDAGNQPCTWNTRYEVTWLDAARVLLHRDDALTTCTLGPDGRLGSEQVVYTFPDGDRTVEWVGAAGGFPFIASETLDGRGYELFRVEEGGQTRRLLSTYQMRPSFT